MKSKKDVVSKTIAFIIILLGFIASLGIAGIGSFTKIKELIDSQKVEPVYIHSFFEEGKLWFYDASDNLIASYECNGVYCGFAYETIDDEGYALKYFNDGTINEIKTIDDMYAFIIDVPAPQTSENETAEQYTDNEENKYHYETKVQLFHLQSNKIVREYMAVKNYSILPNRTFIVRNMDGKWGVIQFVGQEVNDIISAQYDYIGVFSPTEDLAPTDYDKYVVLANGYWSLLDTTGKSVSTPLTEPIYGYEGETIVTKPSERVHHLYDFKGQKIYDYNFEKTNITGKGYIIAYSEGGIAIVVDNKGTVLAEAELMSGQTPTYEYDSTNKEVVVMASGSEMFRGKDKLYEEFEAPPQISN